MRMTGEKQNLVRRAKFSQCVERVAAAARIEVDKNVIENDRQGVHMICIFANQRQPHRQIELLGGTAAQKLRRNPDAVSALNLDFTTVERSNHAHVAALRHGLALCNTPAFVPSLDKTSFQLRELGLGRLKRGFLIGVHVEEQPGFGHFNRNPFQFMNQAAALFVDFSEFEKLLFIGCGCFGQQHTNIGLNLLDLLRDLRNIVPGAYCGFIERACLLIQLQKTVQLHDPCINVGLMDFVLAGKFSDFQFDFARLIFGLPQLDVACIQTLRTFSNLRIERGCALQPCPVPDHRRYGNEAQNGAGVVVLVKLETQNSDPNQEDKKAKCKPRWSLSVLQ